MWEWVASRKMSGGDYVSVTETSPLHYPTDISATPR